MLFFAIITLIAAIILSSTAGFFSVFGLVSLFSAMTIPVAIMGGALEFGKIVAATWLHHNWKNPKITKIMRTYMISGIVLLMLITSTGVFGFLSAGHIEAAAPSQELQIKIDRDTQQIASEQNAIDRANKELNSLDKSLDVYYNNDKATQGLAARKRQESERKVLADTVKDSQKKIDTINDDLVMLKGQQTASTEKLGPIKYVAELLFSDYQSNIDKAVRIVILLIIFVFDPMAIALIICSSISFSDYFEHRAKAKKVILPPEPIIEAAEPVKEHIEEAPKEAEIIEQPVEAVAEEEQISEPIIEQQTDEVPVEEAKVEESVPDDNEDISSPIPDGGILTRHLDKLLKEKTPDNPNAPFVPNEKFESEKT